MIIFIPLGLFVFILAFSLYTRKYRNPYQLLLVFGKKGSGKTTFLVKKMIWHLNHGWNVYTDIAEVRIPGVNHIENPVDLGAFSPPAHTAFFLDEVNLIWDNRNFKSFRADTQKWFRLQRHYRVKCFLASQTYDCDKKIRDQTDRMYLCTCVSNVFSIARPIIKKPVVTVSDSESESRISEDLKILPFWNWEITFIPRWRNCFDSHACDALPDFKHFMDNNNRILDPDVRKDFKQLRSYWKHQDKITNSRYRHQIRRNVKASQRMRKASNFAEYRARESAFLLEQQRSRSEHSPELAIPANNPLTNT